MKRKIMCMGIIALFIGLIFVPAGASQQISLNKTDAEKNNEPLDIIRHFWGFARNPREIDVSGEIHTKLDAVFMLVSPSNKIIRTSGAYVLIGTEIEKVGMIPLGNDLYFISTWSD